MNPAHQIAEAKSLRRRLTRERLLLLAVIVVALVAVAAHLPP